MKLKRYYLFILILMGIAQHDGMSGAPVEISGRQWWKFQVEDLLASSWTTGTNQKDLYGHKLEISEEDFGNFQQFLESLKASSIVLIQKIQPEVFSATKKHKIPTTFGEKRYKVKIIECQVWKTESKEESFSLQQSISYEELIKEIAGYECKNISNISFSYGGSESNAELKFTVQDPRGVRARFDVHITFEPKLSQ